MAQLRMRDAGGVLRTITRIRMRDAGGILRTIQRIRMRDTGGVTRTVFEYLSVTLDTYAVYSTDSGPAANGLVTSATVTGTVNGGVAPFTYLWSWWGGVVGVSPDTPTAIASTFSGYKVGMVVPEPSYFRLGVEDSNGAVAYSDPVEIALEWFDTR